MSSIGTDTALGFVKHMVVATERGVVKAPVKLEPAGRRGKSCNGLAVGFAGLPYPKRDENGRLIFALPGGHEIAL